MNTTATQLFGGALFSAGLTYGEADESADGRSTTKRGLRGIAAAIVATASLVTAPASFADILHVPDDFPTIQGAINASMGGDEIIVGPGTYEELIDFLGKTITVRSSDGRKVTTINGNDLGTVVTCDSGEGGGTTLDGFTVTGGEAEHGGGAYIGAGSSLMVTACMFSNNSTSAPARGGGLYNGGILAVEDCSFIDNSAAMGGGIYNAGAVTILDCDVSSNYAAYFGGGVYNIGSAMITGCTLAANRASFGIGGAVVGDGMFVDCTFVDSYAVFEGGAVSGNGTFINCSFTDNYSYCLAGALIGDALFINCSLTGNFAFSGGAVVGDSLLLNCTVTDNMAPYGSDAFAGDLTISNCIVWNGLDWLDGDATVSFSNVEGGWPGEGNIDADPLFVDPETGDFRLSPGSPCIDAGDNTAAACLISDPDGNNRFFDDPATADTGFGKPPIVDIGAFEFASPPAGVGNDCNGNLLDDVCELAAGITADCNANGVPDSCDIVDGVSTDCNANGILDECESPEDCNGNGVPDLCDIVMGDCNGNGIPDDCDIADGTSEDLNGNGLPDECEAAPFLQHTVDDEFDGARSVYAADINGDGDIDVLGAARNADDITWWENTTGDGGIWTEHIVDGDIEGAHSIFAMDIDGDGDMDIVGAGDTNAVTWWENITGDGTMWTEHVVDPSFNRPTAVFVADIDGDEDLDVVASTENTHRIKWWENTTGDGTVWTARNVASTSLDQAVHVEDVDGDGDMDILSAGVNAVTWWHNTAGDGTSWIEHPVDSDFGANCFFADATCRSVYAVDVDGDGDIDVLANVNNVSWWENTMGDGLSWTMHTVDDDFGGATSVYAADVDGDGDTDVLGASQEFDEIAWWENATGDGTLFTKHVLASDFSGAESVYAADVDDDGDTDVLGAAQNDDDIAWWENLGGCAWDLDGDNSVGTGDLILLLGSWGDPYGTADLIELLGNWGPCPK